MALVDIIRAFEAEHDADNAGHTFRRVAAAGARTGKRMIAGNA